MHLSHVSILRLVCAFVLCQAYVWNAFEKVWAYPMAGSAGRMQLHPVDVNSSSSSLEHTIQCGSLPQLRGSPPSGHASPVFYDALIAEGKDLNDYNPLSQELPEHNAVSASSGHASPAFSDTLEAKGESWKDYGFHEVTKELLERILDHASPTLLDEKLEDFCLQCVELLGDQPDKFSVSL